ncbi:MAG: cation transporter [Alphaproteobacteria bacterium]|nr:cation transporter [Alphaproteobacteria bacterium]
MDIKTQNKWMLFASFASITTALLLVVLKFIAFFATGSMAMLSSLFDSIQDFMTAMVNIVAVRQAIVPADRQHRFGHGKAQGIGSLIQACIIVMAALFLLKESIGYLILGKEIKDIGVGIWVSCIAIILTLGLLILQNWVVKQTGSLCIKTDKAHYTGDIVMNIGVLLSLLLSSSLGWMWIDGVFGVMVGLYLLWAMWHIMQDAFAMLMDKELPEDVRIKIKKVALSVPKVLNVSELKTRQAGNKFFIQFIVQFDGKMTLSLAHKYIDEIENKLATLYPESEIMIHAEPFITQKTRSI